MHTNDDNSGGVPSFIRELMPDASDSELAEATDNLRLYLGVVLRIHRRLLLSNPQPDSRESGTRARFESSNV